MNTDQTDPRPDGHAAEPLALRLDDLLGPLPEPIRRHDGQPMYGAGQLRAYAAEQVAAERERWQRVAAAAQAVTNGAEDIGDFLVSSSLMAALALALDEGPNDLLGPGVGQRGNR